MKTFDLANLKDLVIVSSRVRNDGTYVVPGSAQAECDDCHERVWVGPSTIQVIEEAVRRSIVPPITCFECALPKIMAEGTDADKEEARKRLQMMGVHRKAKDEDTRT